MRQKCLLWFSIVEILWQKHNGTANTNSPGTRTGTRPRGRKTLHCLGDTPPERQRDSVQLLWDTAAPWRCACLGRAEARATAGWETTAAAPRGACRCIAAANEQARVPHYHRDLEKQQTNVQSKKVDINISLRKMMSHRSVSLQEKNMWMTYMAFKCVWFLITVNEIVYDSHLFYTLMSLCTL